MFVVLILILMEYSLGTSILVEMLTVVLMVLILILMEYSLGKRSSNR